MKRFVPSSWNDHQKSGILEKESFPPRAGAAACGARARTGPLTSVIAGTQRSALAELGLSHRASPERRDPLSQANLPRSARALPGLLRRRWPAQRVCNDVGAQGSLPSPLHRLQAVREPHPARGERRAALLPGRPALGPEHRPALLLAQLTIIGKNKAVFKPTVKARLDKYYAKYRGNSAASSAEDAILDGWGSLPFYSPAQEGW